MTEQEKENPKKKTPNLSGLSKVTPKKKVKFYHTPVFQFILVVCGVFILFAYLSKPSESKAIELSSVSDYKPRNMTLHQNLDYIQRLKAIDEKKSKEQQKEKEKNLGDSKKPAPTSISGTTAGYAQAPQKKHKNKLSREMQARLKAPTTFISVEKKASNKPLPINDNHQGERLDITTDSNQLFLKQKRSIGQVNATRLAKPDYTLTAGQLIEATLETAINSQLPGFVRAVTSRDVYSMDGSSVLVPKGSVLMGQYASSGLKQTQTRILITWTRVQLPDGITATLNSPSTDNLGRGGVHADSINRHLIERFGGSLLFSVLGSATANSGVNESDGYNAAQQYRMNIVQSLQKTSQEMLGQNTTLPPTLRLHQGKSIKVFVSKDINFYDVLKKRL